MARMKFLAAAVAAPILLCGPAFADAPRSDDSTEKQRRATELAIQATQMLMHAMELMIRSLPQYGPPYINENGDIIIPRIHEDSGPEQKPDGEKKESPPRNGRGVPL